MLYDPKWEVKADPFSLESLIAWMEKQPAEKAYDYTHPSKCLVAQYLKAMGVKHFSLSVSELKQLGWNRIVNPLYGEHTFGGALKRTRALAAKWFSNAVHENHERPSHHTTARGRQKV